MMWSSPIWSIFGDGLGLVRAAAMRIGSGPVDDARANGLPIQRTEGVGLVRLSGPMVKRACALGRMLGLASTDDVTAAVRAATVDAQVETIMLSVDSPGGSVDGLAELGDAVSVAAKVKPVIAQVDGMAASAAYYAIAGATEIRAGRMDLVGSIGTKFTVWDYSKALESAGIEVVAFDTGPLKSAGEVGTKLTDEQRAYFQGLVDAYFTDFKSQVQRGRPGVNMAEATTGAVWPAGEALAMGLVDKIGTFRQTYGELMDASRQRRNRIAARVKTMQMQAGTHNQ